jgi:copper transport protein
MALASTLLLPAAASAHTHLAGLRPEPEAVLEHPPDAVRLVFNQPVDLVAATIRNTAVDVLRRAGGKQLVLRPRTGMRAGRVDVRFRVLSKDGHVLRGRYGFTVKRGAAVVVPARDEALRLSGGGTSTSAAIAHGVNHLWFVLAVGLVLVGPLVLPAAGVAMPAGLLRAICVAGAATAVLCASLTWLAAEGGEATRALLPGTIGDAADTSAGAGWLLRAGLWAVAAVAVPRRLVAGAALGAIALSLALSGHAGSYGGAGSVAVDTVHLLAAGTWLGGLAVLAMSMRGDGAAARAAYARVALLAFAALVVSGALNAVLRLGSVDALTDGAYGRLVIAKAAVAALIAAVALTAALRRRQTVLELGLGASALVLAAVLVETGPPS